MSRLDTYTDLTGFVPTRFRRLVFSGTDGSTQFAVSYTFAGAVNYVKAQGAVSGSGPSLTATGSDTNVDMNISAKGTGGCYFGNGFGVAAAFVDSGQATTTVNYLAFAGSKSGTSPTLTATGSDTNLDLTLAPKGTGNVRFGTFSSNADAPITGYITIKDAAGNTRKLATIA